MKVSRLSLWFLFYVHWLVFLPATNVFSQEITQIGYTQTGKASYFSDDRKGASTRSGEKYDPSALEAAHASIAFNSLVKITNLDNRKETIVRINDRPLTNDRIIDITKAAADALGITDQKTVVEVKIELIQLAVPRNNAREILADAYRRIATKPSEEAEEQTKEEEIFARYEGENDTKEVLPDENNDKEKESLPVKISTKPEKDEKLIALEKEKVAQKKLADQKKKEVESKKLAENKKAIVKAKSLENTKSKGVISGTANPKVKSKDKATFDPTSTYTTEGEKVSPDGFGVQVASYDEIDKALRQGAILEKLKLGKIYIQAGWAGGNKTYRILVGSFKTKALAQKTADKLNKKNYQSFPKKHFE